MDGLTMKNGREINNRPDSETGIAKLARVRREMKRAEKISIIADGNAVAEARKIIVKKFK